MSDKLVRQTAKLLGASAVAGFGFTFGRELYKKAKGSAVLLFVLFVLSFGVYNSGLMIARNYPSRWEAAIKRILGFSIGIPSAAIIWFMTASLLYPPSLLDEMELDEMLSLHHSYYTIPAAPVAVLFAIGVFRGAA